VNENAVIFQKRPLARLQKYFRVRYETAPLEKALRKYFGDRLLGESTKRLVIPAYNLGEDSVYLFKTPHHERLRRDHKVPMWKVALATGAAPTFFPSYHGVDHVWLVDGGVWANNPTMVGVVEAASMLGTPLSSISVLSLGTTDELKHRSAKLRRGGQWQWRNAAVDVIMRGQSVGVFTQAQHLLGKDKVTRIDPQVPDGLFALDDVSAEAILGKAAHISRHFAPNVKTSFAPHTAAEYLPEKMNPKGGAT
jgi:patatin-like phospholipase/acyl hydrolase